MAIKLVLSLTNIEISHDKNKIVMSSLKKYIKGGNLNSFYMFIEFDVYYSAAKRW